MPVQKQLRQQICAKRTALPREERTKATTKLIKQFSKIAIYQQSNNIASYFAVNGEIDPNIILQQNKTFYLPILNPRLPRHLLFTQYHIGEPLTLNRYKIPEPELYENKIIAVENLDLVLVPLVAFDLQGNRLGMGAGYYDSTFSFLLNKTRPAKPYLIGLAYEWQRVKKLIPESWDVNLDAVVTDKSFYEFHTYQQKS